jgi:hypothetical protein
MTECHDPPSTLNVRPTADQRLTSWEARRATITIECISVVIVAKEYVNDAAVYCEIEAQVDASHFAYQIHPALSIAALQAIFLYLQHQYSLYGHRDVWRHQLSTEMSVRSEYAATQPHYNQP